MVLNTVDVYKEIFNAWYLRCCNAWLSITATVFVLYDVQKGENTVTAQLPPYTLLGLIREVNKCPWQDTEVSMG